MTVTVILTIVALVLLVIWLYSMYRNDSAQSAMEAEGEQAPTRSSSYRAQQYGGNHAKYAWNGQTGPTVKNTT